MSIQVLNQQVSSATANVGDHVDPDGPLKDRTLSRGDVPDEWIEPIFEAENFIIEGPASVEIVDRSGQQIQMEAVADALQRFVESEREPGIISVKHDDVPVGVPIWQWDTDNGEHYETVVTESEFVLVANIGNETTKSKLARLRCLNGGYDGYSVTVYSNQEHQQPDGTRVTVDCDLHAVTLGANELLMNPAADFDVVDFKAGGPLAAAIQRRLRRQSSAAGRIEQKLAGADDDTVDQKQFPDTFPFAGVSECKDRVENDDDFDVDDPGAFCAEWVREVKGEEPAADQQLLRRDILARL